MLRSFLSVLIRCSNFSTNQKALKNQHSVNEKYHSFESCPYANKSPIQQLAAKMFFSFCSDQHIFRLFVVKHKAITMVIISLSFSHPSIAYYFTEDACLGSGKVHFHFVPHFALSSFLFLHLPLAFERLNYLYFEPLSFFFSSMFVLGATLVEGDEQQDWAHGILTLELMCIKITQKSFIYVDYVAY